MLTVWVKEKKAVRAAKILIAGDGDIADLCTAIKQELKRFSDVDDDHIVISRAGLELDRDLLMKTIDAFTPVTAVDVEIYKGE